MRILLIEDNPGDVVLIRQILSAALPSVEIHIAMDGEQGLRMLCETDMKPDLIILDEYPEDSWDSTPRAVSSCCPGCGFLVTSNPAEIQRARELGVREFVQKPIDFQEFEKVVRRMVQRWVNQSTRQTAP